MVQHGISWAAIRETAQRVLVLDGEPLAGNHTKLIGHLASSNDHPAEWLKIWVTIVQMLGLAYTAEQGTTIHATDMARFAAAHDDSDTFFLMWAIRFQFPHGYPKQKHFVENRFCVQPIVLLIEYLLTLEKIGSAAQRYLSFDEIINFCMRRSNHDATTTERDAREILKNRGRKYDYAGEQAATGSGYAAVRQNFSARSRLYFEPTGLLKFEKERIVIAPAAVKGLPFALAFRKDPIPFGANTEEARNRYIRTAFSFTPEYISDLKTAFTKAVLPKKGPSEDEVLEGTADEWVQTKKAAKSKQELLAEAKKYVPGVGSKFKYGGAKVRIDDAKQKALIKQLEDFSCQIDNWSLEYKNKKGETRRYIEAAHIQAKGSLGNEAVSNILILCPNCHKRFDNGGFVVDFAKKALIATDGSVIKIHHDNHLFKD